MNSTRLTVSTSEISAKTCEDSLRMLEDCKNPDLWLRGDPQTPVPPPAPPPVVRRSEPAVPPPPPLVMELTTSSSWSLAKGRGEAVAWLAEKVYYILGIQGIQGWGNSNLIIGKIITFTSAVNCLIWFSIFLLKTMWAVVVADCVADLPPMGLPVALLLDRSWNYQRKILKLCVIMKADEHQ